MTTNAFFLRKGDLFVPTGMGVSPWNTAAHGGVSLSGLVAHALDHVPSPAAMQTTRVTIDILGAIPLDPIAVTNRIVREGKRVQLIELEFVVLGKVWLRATALRLRIGKSPPLGVPLAHSCPGDDAAVQHASGWMDMIAVKSNFITPGPGACWVRFPCEVVAGEPVSPLQSVAMVSDFGFGIASPFSMAEWTFANLDISIHLTRLPSSEWVLIDAVGESAGNGIAISNTRLGDSEGMFGSAHQSIFLERRK